MTNACPHHGYRHVPEYWALATMPSPVTLNKNSNWSPHRDHPSTNQEDPSLHVHHTMLATVLMLTRKPDKLTLLPCLLH
jgi:hypothetical protein